MHKKYFGTDGIRGEANKELTVELALKLGQALAVTLIKQNEEAKVLIGMDTRISGEMLTTAIASGLSSIGIKVNIVGIIPTPGLSFLTKKMKFDAGIMISASHNPARDNGIKIFDKNGHKLSDNVELEIENLIENTNELYIMKKSGDRVGQIKTSLEYKFLYHEFLKNSVDSKFDNIKIILDEANGAASTLASEIFSELGGDVVAINDVPNGKNINLKCGSTDISVLQKVAKDYNADIGFAYDGDADRVIGINENGDILNGDVMISILATYLKNDKKLKQNKVVGTIMTNMGIEKYLNSIGVELIRTKVGDRYVLEKMLEQNLSLGGEQSGHLILKDFINTGDGILASLQFLSIISKDKSLMDIVKKIKKYPQVLKNLRIDKSLKKVWRKNKTISEFILKKEQELGNKGRIVLRESGTEPLIRLMVEADSYELVDKYVSDIYGFLARELE